MRRRLLASVVALTMLVASLGSAAAYWTADPGPDPDRCQTWLNAIEGGYGGDVNRKGTAAYYFDHYNCTWVDEGPSSTSSTSGVASRR